MCIHLRLVVLQTYLFLKLLHGMGGWYTRAGEMPGTKLPDVLLAAGSSHFPDQPALRIKSAAADCRACHHYSFCLFITQSAWLFCSIKLTRIRKCSIGVVWLLPLLFPSYWHRHYSAPTTQRLQQHSRPGRQPLQGDLRQMAVCRGREFNSSASLHCDDGFPPQRK